MRTMIDLGSQRGHLQIMSTPTSVDCGRDVRLRRTFRSLIECMVPYCCTYQPSPSDHQNDAVSVSSATSSSSSSDHSFSSSSSASHQNSLVVTGTFFGHRRGRVSFCLHDDLRGGSPPLLHLDLAVPTSTFAREMDQGSVRITLECDRRSNHGSSMLFQVPVWTMYCNGRKVGYAVRRQVTANDAAFLRKMQSVSVGAGVLPLGDDEALYMRARFERVSGSTDSESFHMMNPGGGYGQELSIFFLRS
ncbi:PREDICTED: protein MIZU-KUSSEI 1 [Tarenaya hassleriana]|uniref:protein MIZU-KUSSEI 1 n=1 Tax=Tarenaya hassleriana TaxID=28532 RepID=UPI00053C7B23|nr:PREDICTED: protein MIZU-KUSSEI 1 [Tarenaya hassleriana]